MTIRLAKILLVAGLALYDSLVALNNLFDFDSNYQFVRHVLLMDTTFPGNHVMGRAIQSPALYLTFYLAIIAWEIVMAILAWWGAGRLLRVRTAAAARFNAAKNVAILALTASLMLWLVAFLTIGAEWFLMWQSKTWDGRQEAFRNFAVAGIVLFFLAQPDTETQP